MASTRRPGVSCRTAGSRWFPHKTVVVDGTRAGTVADGTQVPDGTIVIHGTRWYRLGRWDPFEAARRCRGPALAGPLDRLLKSDGKKGPPGQVIGDPFAQAHERPTASTRSPNVVRRNSERTAIHACGRSSSPAFGPDGWGLGAYARARTFLTRAAYHWPPRGVDMPLALRSESE